MKQFCVLELPISYCVSFIHGYNNFAHFHIFQKEHFSAVKFDIGYEKNMSFLVIPKSLQVWKKLHKSDWTPFFLRTQYLQYKDKFKKSQESKTDSHSLTQTSIEL